jgi:hypothetical protein
MLPNGQKPENKSSERPAESPGPSPLSWSARYGERHRLVRVENFPAGIAAPKKVRIYFRRDHYVLQWWDPRQKATLSHRVEGDLVTAIARAREFEERLRTARSSGRPRNRRVRHAELVARFQDDLTRRADAGEIEPVTVRRYGAALRHYLDFCDQPSIHKTFPDAASVNRDFRLALAAFLATRMVSGNGRGGAPARAMKGQAFVLDTVRALFEWAIDPDRGGLLPEGFRNPFRRAGTTRSLLKGDPLAGPDISLPMALDLVGACDAWQLRLFAPMLLFGLRAAEPCYLFAEYVQDGWLQVPCNPDLNVKTKGKRPKRFPLLEELKPLWELLTSGRRTGLLYVRRSVDAGRERPPLLGRSLPELIQEYRRRCVRPQAVSALEKQPLRDSVLHDAGGLTYDHVEAEFTRLARRLRWPAAATAKDLRHLFATSMHDAGLPEAYRRYLMGQAPSGAAVTAYTHLNELARHYAGAVRREWQPLVEAILRRLSVISSRP